MISYAKNGTKTPADLSPVLLRGSNYSIPSNRVQQLYGRHMLLSVMIHATDRIGKTLLEHVEEVLPQYGNVLDCRAIVRSVAVHKLNFCDLSVFLGPESDLHL